MQWGASLSKSNFPHPIEFRPERWLDSPGLHSYLSQKLAYFKLRLLLVKAVFNFDLELPGGLGSEVKWADQKTLLLG